MKWCYNCVGGNVFVEKGDGFAKILNPVEKKKLILGKTSDQLNQNILNYLKGWAGDLCYASTINQMPIGQLTQDGAGIQDLNSFKLNIEKSIRSKEIQKHIAKRPAGAFDVVRFNHPFNWCVYGAFGLWAVEPIEKLLIIFKDQGYFKEWRIDKHRHPEYFDVDGNPAFTKIAPEPVWNITYCE